MLGPEIGFDWREPCFASLLVHPLDKAIGYDGAGDFQVSGDGGLRRRMGAPAAPYVFTGIQILHPRLFAHAPTENFSMNRLYDRGMSPDGTLHRVRALVHDGEWLHVGDPQGLQQADRFLQEHARGIRSPSRSSPTDSPLPE